MKGRAEDEACEACDERQHLEDRGAAERASYSRGNQSGSSRDGGWAISSTQKQNKRTSCMQKVHTQKTVG